MNWTTTSTFGAKSIFIGFDDQNGELLRRRSNNATNCAFSPSQQLGIDENIYFEDVRFEDSLHESDSGLLESQKMNEECEELLKALQQMSLLSRRE